MNQSNRQKKSTKKNSNKSNVSNRKKARTRRSKQQRNTARPLSQKAAAKFDLSHCSKMYLKALTNPFDSSIANACVPDLYDLPTAKYRVVGRGSSFAGTGGVGFCVLNPYAGAVRDATYLATTTATYTGTIVNTVNPTTGVAFQFLSQSPYVFADLGNGNGSVQARVVGIGLRLRFTGTELNRGGRIIICRLPNMQQSSNSYTAANLLDLRTAITTSVTRGWHSVAFQPASALDYQYYATLANVSVQSPLIIFYDGMVTGQGFEYEVVAHYEYSGTVTNITRSHSDLPGMSAIKDALNDQAELKEPGPSVFDSTLRWIEDNGIFETSGAAALRLGEGYLRSKLL